MALSRRTCAVGLISSVIAACAGSSAIIGCDRNGGDDPSGSGSGAGSGGSGSASGSGSGAGSGGSGSGSGNASGGGAGSASGGGAGSASGGGAGSGGSGTSECSPACGAGESCCGGVCTNGFCAPEVLALAPLPWALAVDPATDSVYWTSHGFNGNLSGVFRVKRDRTGYAHLYDTYGSRGIAVDDSGIYWTYEDGVMKGAKDGSGSAAIFAPVEGSPEYDILNSSGSCIDTSFLGIALDPTGVFFTGGECQTVMRIDKSGGNFSLVIPGLMPEQAFRIGEGLVIDADRVYSTRGLWAAGKDGSGLSHLSQDPQDGGDQGLAVDDTYVYVRGYDHLRRVKKDGSGADVLATWSNCGVVHHPLNLTIDDTYIYWLEQCSGEILRMPKPAGPVDVLYATTPNTTVALVNDDEHLYWTESTLDQGGRIMKMQKP